MVARETGASAEATRSIYGGNLEAAITPTLSSHRLGLIEIEIDQLARHCLGSGCRISTVQ